MTMEAKPFDVSDKERSPSTFQDHVRGRQFSVQPADQAIIASDVNDLHRGLSGIHTSMIAIGGAIGAGLFVSAGGAFANGGPASVLIGFIIISVMMVCVMQALGEMATLYPQNGAFTAYIIRFVDPSWGFAMGLIYAISWLTVLPFELTAAGLTIDYWTNGDINVGVWIAVFLVAMFIIQAFGVRAYGWSEVFLSSIKVIAIIGFCLFAIIDNAGGVKTDPRGYIGFRFWGDGNAFRDGFHGFCGVFVTAAFSFGGTELVGLTAAETKNPEKQIPKAIRQTTARIIIFYLLSLFLVGLIVPASNPHLLDAGSSDTKYSIFVLSFVLAGVKALPSIFNVVITLSVISVANSCTYGSTRTIQALAGYGMLPKFLAYVDKKGRPIPTIILQFLFAMLAFTQEATGGPTFFNWMLSLTAIAYFFVWASICLAHVRFRKAWAAAGRSVDELPYKSWLGVTGSYIGMFLNVISCAAAVYVGVAPPTYGWSGVTTLFQQILAIPLIIFFYVVYKIYVLIKVPAQRPLYTKISNINVFENMRDYTLDSVGPNVSDDVRRQSVANHQAEKSTGVKGAAKKVFTTMF